MSKLPFIDLPGIVSARGTVRLPGSKSLSNRILLLAALAEGETEVRDLLKSDDTDRMLEALNTLGVRVMPVGEGAVKVVGCGGNVPVKSADLFLGNAGTAFRPLTAALALMLIILWWGFDYAVRGSVQTMAGLEVLSMFWAYIALPVGALFSIIAIVANYLDPRRMELETAQ